MPENKFSINEALKSLKEEVDEMEAEEVEVEEEKPESPSAYQKIIDKFGDHNDRYLMVAEAYDRAPSHRIYKLRFNAPNDYLAFFAMTLHDEPTEENILAYYEEEGLEEFFEEYPTIEAIKEFAEANWWGDGDDYIILLENASKEEDLYSAPYDED